MGYKSLASCCLPIGKSFEICCCLNRSSALKPNSMPAIIENNSTADQEITQERRDSTFTYERRDSSEEMDRLSLSRSTDHLRTDSVDSGISSPLTFRAPAAGVNVSMKRSSSASMQSQNRCSSGSSISVK